MRIDMTGRTYGRLTVIEIGSVKGSNQWWVCRCNCGKIKEIPGNHLRRGTSTSCGCYALEVRAAQNRTHGMSGTPEHRAWKQMNRRCDWVTGPSYHHYGGRGIKVCDRWRNSFQNFYEDMGPRPSMQHSIDRLNVDGDYEPSNCKWATKHEQMNNMRKSIRINLFGEITCISSIAKKYNLNYETVQFRYHKGKTGYDLIRPVNG